MTGQALERAVGLLDQPAWRSLSEDLRRVGVNGAQLEALLVRSSTSAFEVGVVRRWRSNGLDESAFSRLEVLDVEDPHLQMIRAGAARVAEAARRFLEQAA